MLRRLALMTALTQGAGVLLGLAAPTAQAVTTARDAYVVDVVQAAGSTPQVSLTSYDGSTGAAPTATVLGTTSADRRGVRLDRPAAATTGTGLSLTAPAGIQLAPGLYSTVSGGLNGSYTTSVPVLSLTRGANGCTAFSLYMGYSSPGWLDVASVTYDGATGDMTSLSATFRMQCSSGGVAYGALRYQTTDDTTAVTSTSSWLGKVVAGSSTPFTVTLANRGTTPVTLAAPTPVDRGTGAPTLAVRADGCSGAPLAAGASCTLDLSYVDSGVPGGGNVAESRLASPDLPRGYVDVLATVQQVVFPPNAPSYVAGDVAYDGVRVRWSWGASGDTPTGYRIRRTDGPSPGVVADIPFMSAWSWVDTSLAKGESATYTVSAYNDAGETAAAPLTLTRPDLPDPPAPDPSSALVVEDGTASGGTAGSSVTVAPGYNPNEVVIRGGGVSVTLSRVPGPGTYDLGSSGPYWASVTSPAYPCSSVTGTVTVREAWITAAMGVTRFDGDLDVLCGNLPIRAQVRVGVSTPVTALTTSALQGFTATVGQAPATQDLTLTNTGDTVVSVGAASFAGPDAASFSEAGRTCPASLPAGQSCTVTVAFSPPYSMTHQATMTLALGTLLGSRTITLMGSATGPPPVQVPVVTAVLGRALVRWYAGPDGGSPVTGFRVLRAGDTGAFTQVASLPAGTYSWTDTGLTPGATYRYQLLIDNQYGAQSPTADQTRTVVVPREELVASYTTGANQPADLAELRVGEDVPVPLGTGQDTDSPALSPDGRWLAYTVTDGSGNAGLWLRAVDGSVAPRVLVDDPTVDEADAAWSPDSSTVAYTRSSSTGTSVWRVPRSGGTASLYPGGSTAAEPSWLPDGSGIVATDLTTLPTTRLVRITTAGARTVLAGTDRGEEPAVSPRGDRLAWVSTDAQGVDHLWLMPLAGGTPQSVWSDVYDLLVRPVWAPDGSAVVLDVVSPYGSSQALLWTPTSVQTLRVAAGYDVYGMTWRREDQTAPVVTFTGGALTTGAARVPFTVVDDTTPLGGLTVTCRVDGGASTSCRSGWAGTLAAGSHTLVVTAQDAWSHTTTATRAFTVDTTAPVVTPSALAAVTLGPTLTFAWSGSDAYGVASYDVRYRRASTTATGFGAWTSPTGWSGTTARTKPLSVSPGYEYCLAVRARDVAGNVSAWSADRCTGTPLDDRALSRSSGWTSVSSSGAYLGTLSRTVVAGARLTRTGYVRRLVVVATTCPTCGSVDVLLGGTRVATLSLRSTTTRSKVLLSLPLRSSTILTGVTLRSTSRAPVFVDGLVLRRT